MDLLNCPMKESIAFERLAFSHVFIVTNVLRISFKYYIIPVVNSSQCKQWGAVLKLTRGGSFRHGKDTCRFSD